MVPELLGLGILGYSDPLGLGVLDCLLLGVLGVLGEGVEKGDFAHCFLTCLFHSSHFRLFFICITCSSLCSRLTPPSVYPPPRFSAGRDQFPALFPQGTRPQDTGTRTQDQGGIIGHPPPISKIPQTVSKPVFRPNFPSHQNHSQNPFRHRK